MFQMWLIIGAALVIGEIFTAGFILIWFGIGAFVGALFSWLNFSLQVQLIAFIIVSVLLLWLTKPITSKFFKYKGKESNVSSMIGKFGLVTQSINNLENTGLVKIDGEVWSARSENSEKIPENNQVEVLRIEGVRVIVKSI